MTYRELLLGNPRAEKLRLISSLERTMSRQTDPELRYAYARSIELLRAQEHTGESHGEITEKPA
jgi:hypothetical protein